MTHEDSAAVKRIFVKVFGFSDRERHAINTLFHLSEARRLTYALWTPAASHPAELGLIDGDNWEASLELANPANDRLRLIWVGSNAPAKTALTLARPLDWSAALDGMDGLLSPTALMDTAPGGGLDFDLNTDIGVLPASAMAVEIDLELDIETGTIKPASAETDTLPLSKDAADALVIDPDLQNRLYLRAKLAVAGHMRVDEVSSAVDALHRLDRRSYELIILNLELPDLDGWQLAREIQKLRPPRKSLILIGSHIGLLGGLRAWLAGAKACLRKPLHPRKLQMLLEKAA